MKWTLTVTIDLINTAVFVDELQLISVNMIISTLNVIDIAQFLIGLGFLVITIYNLRVRDQMSLLWKMEWNPTQKI